MYSRNIPLVKGGCCSHSDCPSTMRSVCSKVATISDKVPYPRGWLLTHGERLVCHIQVTEVLECMTPSNCRLDLQSCAFEALQKEQKLPSASDVSVSTEPWCALLHLSHTSRSRLYMKWPFEQVPP